MEAIHGKRAADDDLVKEFNLFCKFQNQMDRANIVQSAQDITDKLTKPERFAFKTKGWEFRKHEEEEELTDYQHLTLTDSFLYGKYQFTSTYESDLNYDRFYHALLQKLETGMSWSEAKEAAEDLRRNLFPEIDIFLVDVACKDWFEREEWRETTKERLRLEFSMMNEVLNNGKCWVQASVDYRQKWPAYEYTTNRTNKLRNMDSLDRIFEEHRSNVVSNLSDGEVMDKETLIEGYIHNEKVMDVYNKSHTAYADYAREKIRLAKQLGIV